MKTKTFFQCSECGHKAPKWLGKCPKCQEWNTFEEGTEVASAPAKMTVNLRPASDTAAVAFDSLELPNYMRSGTGQAELDRVLGGGIVHGSVILMAGEPGIGKSTLLLQLSASIAKDAKVLYVSGEESGWQLKYRAKRLGLDGAGIFLLTETNIDNIIAQSDEVQPDLIIVDSVQTIYDSRLASTPGSVTQVRECSMRMINLAKTLGISVVFVGHVNKEGGIAGPKVLEHMVDAVLYFEGERTHSFRILRATKNRYGATNEIGVFEMTSGGVIQVENPSEMLLAGRPKGVSGCCAACILEGSRPLAAEIQSLTTPTVFPSPRRTTDGVDYNRTVLLLAVLEKRLGLRFSQNDIYVNVVGGLRIDEPASDLPQALALISSIKDKPIDPDVISFGEIGLAGECRSVSHLDLRINEAVRLGFTKILVPHGAKSLPAMPKDVQLVPVKGVFDASNYLFK